MSDPKAVEAVPVTVEDSEAGHPALLTVELKRARRAGQRAGKPAHIDTEFVLVLWGGPSGYLQVKLAGDALAYVRAVLNAPAHEEPDND